MSQVDIITIVRAAKAAGFKAGGGLAYALAVSFAEDTTHDDHAVYVNTDGSRDRGLWQINDKYHPEVTDEEAFDPYKAAEAAWEISGHGANFGAWTTWGNGLAHQKMELAWLAIRCSDAIDRATKAESDLKATRIGLDACTAARDLANQKIAAAKAALA
jgi:hypothetical protein